MSFTSDQEDALRGLTRFVVGEAPLPELMQRIATAAQQAIGPVSEASVTFTRGDDHGWTVASTGELASQLDEAQYALGHGPCMDAAAGGTMLLIDDLATDDRYPTYGPIAAAAGGRSSLSVPFPMQQHVVAALNLYSENIGAFGPPDVDVAIDVAAQAAIAVANAILYESAVELATQLRQAMESRAVIEQAKGIVMATSRCGPDDAFAVLVRASQRENRKLRDLAADMVERHSRVS